MTSESQVFATKTVMKYRILPTDNKLLKFGKILMAIKAMIL